LIRVNRFALVGPLLVGFGLAAVTFSGGCSSGDQAPVLTDAQKAAQVKEITEQASANDAAAKATPKRSNALPP